MAREPMGDIARRASDYPIQKKRNRPTNFPEHQGLEEKSHRTTAVASLWISLGNSHGLDFPFNDIWLGNQLHARIIGDEVFQDLLEDNQLDMVKRLLEKMVRLFWQEYTDGETTSRNAKDQFFEVWFDLRYYSMSSLHAAWLKTHGVRVPPKEYADKEDQEMQQALKEARMKKFLEEALDE